MINDIKTETKDFSIDEIKLLIKHELIWKLRMQEIGVYWKEWNKSEFNWKQQR